MIAVFILTVSIGGPLTIITKGLTAAFFARDQITAFYLAQEAVEHIRNRRDTNSIQGAYWLDGLDPECTSVDLSGFSIPCRVDVRQLPPDDVVVCPGGCSPLLYDTTLNFYTYIVGDTSESAFTREIRMAQVVVDDEYTISVDVTWRTGRLTRTFTVKEHIFNWQQ